MSGGELITDDYRRAIRVVGEFDNVSEIENLIVKAEHQDPVFMRDIAEVSFGFKDRTSYARSDGNPVVSLDVIKKSGKNLLMASDKVKGILEEAQTNVLPENLDVTLFNDQSINTKDQVQNLENSIISGVILVVLVILFFMGIRNAAFVGIAIPLSMLLGIMILSITGTTMNIVVLFSLILALGLLVDNAIVVVENIYRYIQEGYSGHDAAIYGASEVAMPIIASTATTLAAFLPLAFWPGLMGAFMKYMPLTLIIVLTSSLFVALVINPVLTSRFMRVDRKLAERNRRVRKRNNILLWSGILLVLALLMFLVKAEPVGRLLLIAGLFGPLNYFVLRPASFGFQNTVLPKLEDFYDRFIQGALRIPFIVFGGTFILLIASIVLLGMKSPKVIFFPSADPLYVNVFVDMPLGTDIEATNDMVLELESKISAAVEPYGQVVEAVLTQIGESTSDPQSPPEPGPTPHKARITSSFVAANKRGDVSTFDIMDDIREAVKGYPGVQISVDKNAEGPPTGKPINLELRGENISQLTILAEEITAFINDLGIPGIEELQRDVKLGKPELLINIDREAARKFGLSTFSIADAIRTAVYGKEISKYKLGEDEYDIYVRLDEKYRYNVQDLLNQKVTFMSQSEGRVLQVPISAVADIEYSSTYSSVKRRNLDKVITIFSNVEEGYNANEIVAELQEALLEFQMPEGFEYEFTGEQEQQAEDMSFLVSAFAVALFSIFLIIVAQFNSIISPFIIIFSVLFSTIGVFLGYVFSGMDVVIIMTGVGIISLAGVVVNNAIVLIDYINLMIDRKKNEKGVSSMFSLTREEIKHSIEKAGAIRLRPVLLTAITTVLGLIPLAVGFNFNFFTLIGEGDPNIFIGGDNVAFWGPMAWTVIYGLVFATFLTLVVVPVMYWLAYRLILVLSGLNRKVKNKEVFENIKPAGA
jgi:multidrug efflux pump subunit AcrB